MATLWFATSGSRASEYLAAAEVQRVEIDVGDGDVEIVGGGLDEVAVRRTDHYAYHRYPSEWRTLENGVARISSRCPSLVIGSCASDYRVTVSDNVPVSVRVERGDVRLTNYRGSADLDSRAGSILVDGFCGFVLEAATKAGDIDARTACSAERLELRTDTGDVHAVVPSGRYRVDADTNSGGVTVRGVADALDAPWSIQALSSTGDVTVEAGP
jgi:Putative adhesin